jgi:hypothetical protein
MVALATASAKGEVEPETARTQISTLAIESRHPESSVKAALVEGWGSALNAYMQDSVLSKDEETNLMKFAKTLGLEQEDLDKKGAYTLAAQAAVLREVLSGNVPSIFSFERDPPFNFEKDEKIVWYHYAGYMKEKTVRSFVGGSQGVSVRVMKGVYYRVNAFQGHPVEKSQLEAIDAGRLAITDKHIYFGGEKTSFRIPLKKIVGFVPFSDGFGLFRDTPNAKQEVFVTEHGWFYMNLLTNLSKL